MAAADAVPEEMLTEPVRMNPMLARQGKKIKEKTEGLGDPVLGAVEAAAQIGTGLAAIPLASVYGTYKDITSRKPGDPYSGQEAGRKAFDEAAQAMTYQPRTETGKSYAEDVGAAFEASKIPPFMGEMGAVHSIPKAGKLLMENAAERDPYFAGVGGAQRGVVKATGEDKLALKTARKLKLSGVEPEAIAARTGWVQDAKGRWQFEGKPETAATAAEMVLDPLNYLPVIGKAPAAARAVGRAASQIANAELVGRSGLSGQRGAITYHGTPHRFPPTANNPLGEFDASKIGTGEGAQAYGHGLYLAENPGVAKGYQKDVTRKLFDTNSILGWGEGRVQLNPGDSGMLFKYARGTLPPIEAAKKLKINAGSAGAYSDETIADAITKIREQTKGNLYKVDLPDEQIAKMLDWDKPLSKQSAEVQAAFKLLDMGGTPAWDEITGINLYNQLAGRLNVRNPSPMSGSEAASDFLKKAGIPGIKYLDQGSRAGGSGTSNFVVFDPALMNILERDGVTAPAPQAPMAAPQAPGEMLGAPPKEPAAALEAAPVPVAAEAPAPAPQAPMAAPQAPGEMLGAPPQAAAPTAPPAPAPVPPAPPPQGTGVELGRGDVAQHSLMAERGERGMTESSIITAPERERIRAAGQEFNVPMTEIEAQVRARKMAHPAEDGWEPLEFNRAVSDKKGGYEIEYKGVPYSFEKDATGKILEPGTPEHAAKVDELANKVTSEITDIYDRVLAGDAAAEKIIRQAGWYKVMRSRLRQEFGGLGDLFADLLGAMSPNTPVRENWKNAIDMLRRASRGDFDEIMPKWEEWATNAEKKERAIEDWFTPIVTEREQRAKAAKQALEAFETEKKDAGAKRAQILADPEYKALLAASKEAATLATKKAIKALPEFTTLLKEVKAARKLPKELIPLKEAGPKYGFNGQNGVRAMVDLWRKVKDPMPDIGRGGTAPKALNFSGNLIGLTNKATIDVWAARLLQRLADKLRIPSAAEGAVKGNRLSTGASTDQFGFGQDVFEKAAERIRNDPRLAQDELLASMNPDDLQAVVWFKEKELWTKNNWTSAAGEGGSFEFESDLAGIKDQAEVNRLRKIADSSIAATDAQKAAAAGRIEDLTARKVDLQAKKAEVEGTRQKNRLDKDIKDINNQISRQKAIIKKPSQAENLAGRQAAMGELEAMQRPLERYVGGVSTETAGYVPTDPEMAATADKLRQAAYKSDDGATVMASKVLSTEGRYGAPERSFDLELVVKDGYDPHPLLQETFQTAMDRNQDAAMLSRVLRHDEEPNLMQHRPGLEIYFRDAKAIDELQPILDQLKKEGINAYTVAVDGRRSVAALRGEMPPAVGVRIQTVPEYEQRFGVFDWSKLTNKAMADQMEMRAMKMERVAQRLMRQVKGITEAQQLWYDTEVRFKNEYKERINEIATGATAGKQAQAGTRVWKGRPIREGVDSANTWAKESDAGTQTGEVQRGDGPGANQPKVEGAYKVPASIEEFAADAKAGKVKVGDTVIKPDGARITLTRLPE